MQFEYSQSFRQHVEALHDGKKTWPYYQEYIDAHLGGPSSRLALFCCELIPEIEYHCGPLRDRSILDFGCGTGASTVALALLGARVLGFDSDRQSVSIADQRVREHALTNATVCCGERVDDLPIGQFDVVLMNGVIEHIPASVTGLRARVIADAAGRVCEGGYLFVSDTPNRLIPFDGHSTRLWWIPWSRPGSTWAYRRAIRLGRHSDTPKETPGPRGLEEVGAWGSTFWEVRNALPRPFSWRCVNLEPGHNRRMFYSRQLSKKGRLFEGIVFCTLSRLFRAPITAFAPGLNNLAFRKE